ncbi:DUF4113 domain-containing protein [Halomonas sp. PA16-9]|uniref:DUF4113 domain-containing protein n=1 Tax=Halomonas sp. PA16-9 TaxID=2576841 RepID=UPI0030EBBAED
MGLPEKNAPWHLRCANRSPRYTTNWDELMVAYTDEGAANKNKRTPLPNCKWANKTSKKQHTNP